MARDQVLFLVFSYLLGAVPFGYLIVRLAAKQDIRETGSRSTGATNVLRSRGLAAALATLVLDVAKGAVPVLYGRAHQYPEALVIAGAAAAVAGHIFPVYIRFRGGKGVGTLAGAFLVFQFPALAAFFAVWLPLIAWTRYVSLGSVCGVLALFFFVLFSRTAEVSAVVLVAAILVIGRHAANIRRLLAGSENRLQLRRKAHGS